MARKPKAPPSTEAAATISGQKRAARDATPASAGKGRKPKSAAQTPEVATALESGATAMVGVDAAAQAADAPEVPDRGRRGRMPKQAASAPAASLLQEHATGRRGRKSSQPEVEPEPNEPEPNEAEAMTTEAAASATTAARRDTAPSVPDPGTPTTGTLRSSSSPDLSVPSKPAAHWDRATDMVRFDWPEIERTASQEGPNQAMAKLLVAARAEGANSRWPL